MTTTSILLATKPYWVMGLLLPCAVGCAFALRALALRSLIRFSDALMAMRLVTVAMLALPCALPLLPRATLARPSVQVWSGGESRHATPYSLLASPRLGPGDARTNGLTLSKAAVDGALAFFALGIAVAFARLAIRLRRLRRHVECLHSFKRVGRIRLYIEGGTASCAYSAWVPGLSAVVLPEWMITRRDELRLAIAHELQHHRGGDTQATVFFEALCALFFWNPFARVLANALGTFQEFACDETLVGRRGLSPRAYGRCLLRAAETAFHSRQLPVGATGMAAGGRLLKRRVEMLFHHRSHATKTGRLAAALLSLAALAAISAAAYASQSAVQDRKLTLDEARAYARAAQAQGTVVPIDMNERVLAQLNRLVGTPEGRTYVRDAFLRLPQYRALIDSATRAHGLPEELAAEAMFESGLRNDAVSPPPYSAAGIWQFIPATARHYGMQVDEARDDRLNPRVETEAAMNYLSHLFDLFQDWRLAIKAYNEGERAVFGQIASTGSRDPWVLEAAHSTENYLPGVIAMMILYKNPALLN